MSGKIRKDKEQHNLKLGQEEQEEVLRSHKSLMCRLMERLIPNKQEYEAMYEQAMREKNRWTELPNGWKIPNLQTEMTDEEVDILVHIPELQEKLCFYEQHRQQMRQTEEAALRFVLCRLGYKVLRPIVVRLRVFEKQKER